MATTTQQPLLDPEFLHKLEQLELVSRKIFLGRAKGERRSKRRGTSVEFVDHRNYVAGDDLRFIDWNIMIRLDRLFIKLFEEEEDLHFHILIDSSRSMDFGDPTKLRFAKQVAAALAFIGLVNLDRVMISSYRDDIAETMPAARGRRSLWRVMDFLERSKPMGAAISPPVVARSPSAIPAKGSSSYSPTCSTRTVSMKDCAICKRGRWTSS